MNRAYSSLRAIARPSRALSWACEKTCEITWKSCESLLILLFISLLSSCAGGGSAGSSGGATQASVIPVVTVAVAPQTATVPTNGTAQFIATVASISGAALQWEVNHVPGGDGTMGTINSAGLYQAPANVPP